MRLAALALCLLPALPPKPQDPAGEAPAADALSSRERVHQELREKMEGAWSLMRLSHSQGGVEDAAVSGFMLMVDGYMSIVIHALDPGGGEAAPLLLFQASVNAFELRGVGEMFCASQIGHSNFGPAFEPELENLPRIFGIEFNGEDLTLVREDDSRLQFRRLKQGYFPPGADSYLNELGELNRR